ncbi:hypothetical protein FQA39_LY05409 [Lamprigera yunnana]|nr:hypothetical protein FQA39_LY05409 [Lamprigera yunnana]
MPTRGAVNFAASLAVINKKKLQSVQTIFAMEYGATKLLSSPQNLNCEANDDVSVVVEDAPTTNKSIEKEISSNLVTLYNLCLERML